MSNNKNGKNATSLPLVRLFPNIVTIIGLCFGMFAIKYAMLERWEMAVTFIIIAAVIDGIDGRLARMLNASSNFGAQLDSFADFLNFGIAPAMILYMWKIHEIKGLGWAIALFFIISQALRLARFNAAGMDEDDEEDEDSKLLNEKFFTGISAPMGASLSVAPMMIEFLLYEKFIEPPFSIHPLSVIIFMAIIAALMVSRVPTLSIKKMKIRRKHASFALALSGIIVICLIVDPWITLPIVGVLYLLTIPFTIAQYYRLKGAKT
ncbi:phosphatidylcholine/phosphatidylserine synthase [Rickettsiales bacterium]|nr:phosphatidylcholine/phosphatidylserine synthase [Rickettsiales bacterium]